MATPNKLAELEEQRGEKMEVLIPRLLNELGTMEAVASELGVHYRTIYRWCELKGIQRRVVYSLPKVSYVTQH